MRVLAHSLQNFLLAAVILIVAPQSAHGAMDPTTSLSRLGGVPIPAPAFGESPWHRQVSSIGALGLAEAFPIEAERCRFDSVFDSFSCSYPLG